MALGGNDRIISDDYIKLPVTDLASIKAIDITVTIQNTIANSDIGTFEYKPLSTNTPDDVSIIKPDSVTLPAPGRWEISSSMAFANLSDVVASYGSIGALTAVNATTNGMLESTTLLTEPAANQFSLTRGSSVLSISSTCLINQNLSTTSSVSFSNVTTGILTEGVASGGITFSFAGGSGNFYDYTNQWFSMSGSGAPDDGTNLYIPYSSGDGWYFGWGMDDSDSIYMGKGANQFALTGDGQLSVQKLTLNIGTQVDNISIDGTFAAASNDMLSTSLAIKTYVDNSVGSGLWELSGTTIRVPNTVTANTVDLSYGTLSLSASGITSYGNISTSGGDLLLPTNRVITIDSKTLSCDASARHKTVGYAEFTDSNTIGVLLTAITDSAENKRYLITGAPIDSAVQDYYNENMNFSSDPYVSFNLPSGRVAGYIHVGDNNALNVDEVNPDGNGDSCIVKTAGTAHSYVTVNKARAGSVNSRSCAYSNAGTLDLFANLLEVGYGTAIGGDPASAESSSGDVNAFVNQISLTSAGDVINNAVVAQDGGVTSTFINRIDCVGGLKRIYDVNDANSGLYSTFNFSQGATYILDQSSGYASIIGGYADGDINVVGNFGTWIRLNRQGNNNIYIAGTGDAVYIDVLNSQADVSVETGATLYLTSQNLTGDIDTNSGVGKLICDILEWSGSFTADKTNVNGFVGVYGDSKKYLYGYDLHLNPTEITNAHYRADTRLTLEDEECHAQFIADDDGGPWGSYLMLSNAPSTGDNKHWLLHHSGAHQNDELKLEYGTSTSSSSFSISERFKFGTTGRFYIPGIGTLSGKSDVQYDTGTNELGYVSSSKRYKTNIVDMEDTNWIYDLRMVNFERKDELGVKQYGIIAEEAEIVNASICGYSYIQEAYTSTRTIKDRKTKENIEITEERFRNTSERQIETVSYTTLITPMLHELQILRKRVDALESQLQ